MAAFRLILSNLSAVFSYMKLRARTSHNRPKHVLSICCSAGGVLAQARLASWQMIVVFGQRLTVSQAPMDLPAARTVTPLNLALAGPAWARVLNQLMAKARLRTHLRHLP